MHHLRLIILTPIWLFYRPRKTWAEFKSGLRPHKCSFDEVVIENKKGKLVAYNTCTWKGCGEREEVE